MSIPVERRQYCCRGRSEPDMAPISSEHTVLLTGFGAFPLQHVIRACWLQSKRELTCPMHGPHAFASTAAPTPSSAEVNPSLSMVARICSEPGVHRNGTYHTAKPLISSNVPPSSLPQPSY